MEKIGLFPIGTVLFPESVIPLHIFEERYKTLIKTCWSQKSQFGIVLMDSAKIFNIGCKADVVDIFNISSDGKMDIIIKGDRRFYINNFIDGEKPYYIGSVSNINDIEEEIDESVLIECVEKFNKIVENLNDLRIDTIDIIKLKSMNPSFYIAAKAGLTIYQRQEILEMKSENQRLTTILEHLAKILPMIKEAEMISRLIRNDGYIFPNKF